MVLLEKMTFLFIYGFETIRRSDTNKDISAEIVITLLFLALVIAV